MILRVMRQPVGDDCRIFAIAHSSQRVRLLEGGSLCAGTDDRNVLLAGDVKDRVYPKRQCIAEHRRTGHRNGA